ncbi:hypothetical protein Tco_0670210, partial [Tanacetum coccineum]
ISHVIRQASSVVTYTSISSDSNGPSWGIPLYTFWSLRHPVYHAPSDDDIQMVEDSIDYPDEPEDDDEDPKEDPEEDHIDYPADGDDGDDEPYDDDDDEDDTNDEDEEPTED